jgi:pentatricopeptide repeat protein
MDGLRDLQEMASREPNNLGAFVALAVAYSQSGQLEQALRLYRRMLGKRNASPSLWQVVAERLSDLELDAAGNAQYHMARGDLLIRQGRMREAVEEYNKIV